jgi:nitroimidazol reductase NimA-like FMN-containing flavoprotein (pyridoxamine 5'-phosphate oxidase superfamily)
MRRWPSAYARDGDAIIGYSPDGLKLWMMRENPKVCVEFDHIDDLVTWRSVIAHGTFQELSGSAADEALSKLKTPLLSLKVSETAAPSHGVDPHARSLDRERFCVYRITLEQKTGRFERQ